MLVTIGYWEQMGFEETLECRDFILHLNVSCRLNVDDTVPRSSSQPKLISIAPHTEREIQKQQSSRKKNISWKNTDSGA